MSSGDGLIIDLASIAFGLIVFGVVLLRFVLRG